MVFTVTIYGCFGFQFPKKINYHISSIHHELTIIWREPLSEGPGSSPMTHGHSTLIGAGVHVPSLSTEDAGNVLLVGPERVHHNTHPQIQHVYST